jgi:hypothetical protein
LHFFHPATIDAGALPIWGIAVSISAIDEFRRQHTIQMEQDEVEYIVSAIRTAPANALMIEWGSGASTIRWLEEMSGSQSLVSIEHNLDWHAIVKPIAEASSQLSERLQYYLCQPSSYWQHGYGETREENPIGLDDYFAPDDTIFDADIFLIDGVARGVCALNVLYRSRKPNPTILLHDWYPRQPWYSWAVRQYPIVERVGSTLVRLGKG